MKSKAAQSLGRNGGKSRARKLTKAERIAIARKAGIASGKARSQRARGGKND